MVKNRENDDKRKIGLVTTTQNHQGNNMDTRKMSNKALRIDYFIKR